MKLYAPREIQQHLRDIADGTGAPAALIMALHWKTRNVEPLSSDTQSYFALRAYYQTNAIKAPNGISYKLPSLQKEYLRYCLVEGFVRSAHTWEKSYELAADYVGKSPTTVRDSHAKIKRLLQDPKMRLFCKGLEYEFPLAMAHEDNIPQDAYLEPDFFEMDEPSDHS